MMTDKGEELALPSAIVMRILKDALPDGINVSKEARNAVSRAAAIFVLYATSCANQIQVSASRKTLSANDVFLALNDMLFEDMVEPLKESLETFQAEKGKKESLSGSPSKVGAPKGRRKKSVNNSSAETSTEPSVEMLDSSSLMQTEDLPTEDSDLIATTE